MLVRIEKPEDDGSEVVKVVVNDWDTWDASMTIAQIAYPLLSRFETILKDPDSVAGSPQVDDEDVPEELRRPTDFDGSGGDVDDNWHARWHYVVGEIVLAMKCCQDWTWEEEYRSGSLKIDFIEEEGVLEFDDSDHHVDEEGLEAMRARVDNGLRLFGKYFRALWW